MPLVLDGTTGFSGGGGVATSTALGSSALFTNSTGTNLVAIGYQAGYFTTAGPNVFVGSQAGYTNSTGTSNVGLGYQALYNNTTTVGSVAIGYQALYSTSSSVALAANEAIGYQALYSLTTGYANQAFGYQALNGNTVGAGNVGIGYQALKANTTNNNNVAVGYTAGLLSTSANNTYLGYIAGYTNVSGASNTYVGSQAGANATGGTNTFVGFAAGSSITTGAKNTILGGHNGNQGGLDIRTASNNIVLSDGDGNPRLYCNSNGRWSMNGGTSALTPVLQIYSTTQDADIQMGSTQNGNDIHLYLVNSTRTSELSQLNHALVARCGGSGGVTLTNGATSWATYSDSRLKNVTGTYTNALADVAKLEPVKFTWKSDSDKKPCVGLIAQSVEKVVPEAIDKVKNPNYKETGDDTEYLTVRYTELIPLMVASIKELKTLVDAQSALITGQAAEIVALKAKVGL